MIFDTHQYVKKAKDAGFTEAQAEFQAEEVSRIIDKQFKVMDDQLATKHDLIDLEQRLTIKFSYMLTAAVAILSVLITLLHK